MEHNSVNEMTFRACILGQGQKYDYIASSGYKCSSAVQSEMNIWFCLIAIISAISM